MHSLKVLCMSYLHLQRDPIALLFDPRPWLALRHRTKEVCYALVSSSVHQGTATVDPRVPHEWDRL